MISTKTAENSARTAIDHTEEVTGLKVTVHDLTHRLWHLLPAERFRHAHPLCHTVKTGRDGAKCIAFEIDHFRTRAHLVPEGRIHVCHAGLSEAAYPVFHQGHLALVLFLGPWQNRPTGDEATRALEAIRQLGARLHRIALELDAPETSQSVSREARIRHFLLGNYQRPLALTDLAAELALSPDRARHAVVESCGQSFRELLAHTRMEAATALLLNTTLTVEEIAQRTGFPHRAAFTRLFRRRMDCSPRDWRCNRQA